MAQELGCKSDVSIKASIRMMLLYVEGATFKPHQDTEKEPGMLATLVVRLSSAFTGCDVVPSQVNSPTC